MKEKRSYIPVGGDPIHMIFHSDRWEEIPDEDLWEDGEISNNTCMIKIYNEVVVEGNWKLIRRKDE